MLTPAQNTEMTIIDSGKNFEATEVSNDVIEVESETNSIEKIENTVECTPADDNSTEKCINLETTYDNLIE